MVPTPKDKRSHIARTDDWQTIKQRSLWPEQVTYEMIRPVVLFSETAAQRAEETGEARRSLYQNVERFEQQGMQGLSRRGVRPLTLVMGIQAAFLDARLQYATPLGS